MTEKINLNLNPKITSVFDSKKRCKKTMLNDDIKDLYLTDGYMFIKKDINKTLDKKVESDDNILNIKLKIKLEDIKEIDARIYHTMLKSDKNTIYVNSKYHIYFKNICDKKGYTLKLSNVNDLPVLYVIKEDDIIMGVLGVRIDGDFLRYFYMEKTIKDYESELYSQNVYNEDIMNTIFTIYKKNVLSSAHIEKFNFYKENLKGYTKKNFKFRKNGIYFNYISEKEKPINDIPLFNKVISYGIIQNYQLLDEFWCFDIKTKKYLYDKILNFFINYMENN